jgi:inner membrane protein involved in colicin E2 resistance
MPLNARHIAVTVAVICFFGLSLISWLSGLAPFSCCKRALTGAVVAYIAASLAVKAINTILINAMIESQQNRDSRNARPEQEGTVR